MKRRISINMYTHTILYLSDCILMAVNAALLPSFYCKRGEDSSVDRLNSYFSISVFFFFALLSGFFPNTNSLSLYISHCTVVNKCNNILWVNEYEDTFNGKRSFSIELFCFWVLFFYWNSIFCSETIFCTDISMLNFDTMLVKCMATAKQIISNRILDAKLCYTTCENHTFGRNEKQKRAWRKYRVKSSTNRNVDSMQLSDKAMNVE